VFRKFHNQSTTQVKCTHAPVEEPAENFDYQSPKVASPKVASPKVAKVASPKVAKVASPKVASRWILKKKPGGFKRYYNAKTPKGLINRAKRILGGGRRRVYF